MMKSSSSLNVSSRGKVSAFVRDKGRVNISKYVLNKKWIFIIVGFLLGRAVILSSVTPFSIAFIATIWFMRKRQSAKVMLAIIIGAFTLSMSQGIFITMALAVFLLLANLFKQLGREQVKLPLFVFLSTITPRLFLYSLFAQLTAYEWVLLFVEGILGAILVLIFMQSLPLLLQERYKPILKNEEIVCMIILIASILTGTIGWEIYGASLEQILSRYLVLVLALVGGAAIGSTVGVVTGLILSLANVANLYQMSLLAFSGLLGGLLKDGNKLGASAGLLIGTCLVGIYGDTNTLLPSIIESLVAIGLLLITPVSLFKNISRYIPGTDEHTNEQEQYLQKIRNVTAKRVEQFSDVFEALSDSFSPVALVQEEAEEKKRETDYFLSEVTETTCQKCFMKKRCWQNNFDTTYSLMEELKDNLMNNNSLQPSLAHAFSKHCVKAPKVIDAIQAEVSIFEASQRLKRQVLESKRLVADQLLGVSEVMDDFAKEILKEREHHEIQEQKIIYALQQMDIELEKLEIYQLDKGNVDIEMTLSFYEYRGEGPKLIAPVLSDVLEELIVVKSEDISPFPNGYCYLSFGSAKEYVVQTGVAHAAKGGGLVSGDSYTMIEIGEGKYALAISDGMGNGERAREESEETLRLLQQILQTGIPEQVAIKSINSILALRTTDEMFATLDLAVINLHNAFVRFLKIGSIPSLLKRDNKIINIEANNLPMGIIHEFEVDIVSEQLMSGDILIMMSDGVLEGPKHIKNVELWLRRKIKSIETNDPQEVADLLLEEVIRTRGGDIEDDMTVLVAKIEKNVPEWASISTYEQVTQESS